MVPVVVLGALAGREPLRPQAGHVGPGPQSPVEEEGHRPVFWKGAGTPGASPRQERGWTTRP